MSGPTTRRPGAAHGIACQLFGGPVARIEAGQLAWYWRHGDLHLVRVVRKAPVAGPNSTEVPGASIVLDGRVVLVSQDRLTAIPTVDAGPRAGEPGSPSHA